MYIKSLPAYSTTNYINIMKPFLEINKMASIKKTIYGCFILTNSLALWNLNVHCCQDISMPCYPILGKCFPVTLIVYLLQIPNYVIFQLNFWPTTWAHTL